MMMLKGGDSVSLRIWVLYKYGGNMSFNKLIVMKKSRKTPCEGDVFCIQPLKGIFYFGKVIKSNIENPDIHGHTLIFIYDIYSSDKNTMFNFENKELLIPPIIVNKQPWIKGYFETLYNTSVLEYEKKLDYGFLNVLKNIIKEEKEYLDINGNIMEHVPQYYDMYALGSYGIVGKNVQKAIICKIVQKMQQSCNFYVKEPSGKLQIPPEHTLPCEVERFYELCGGIECYAKKKKTFIKILSPDEVIQSGHLALGENEGDALCSSWYLIARVEDGNNVFIDFSEEGSGKCYMYTQALSGNWSMLTKNFTEFLLSLCEYEGDDFYCKAIYK